MIFGRFEIGQAEGLVLAHTTRAGGKMLPKGTVLSAEMCEILRASGLDHVVGARLEPGDVAENEAALRLADALAGGGISPTRPGTGRVNLIATRAGLLRADAARIDALNALHEGLTLATLPDATPVAEGSLLATVKIIPFAIGEPVLAQAEVLARAAAPLRVAAFVPLRTGLVLSELPGLKASVLRGTVEATEKRVRALGGTLLNPLRVAHDQAAIAAALGDLLRDGAELLLIAGASATVDRGDVAPSAIVAAGGAIDHFGMPVDPGNLMCLGHIGGVAALVLPGCARSPALNGIDFMLQRLFAGERAGPGDIARMGTGGLLGEFSARPAPRLRTAPPRRIAAIVLAAGLSSRMAPRNKLLLADESGRAMVARTVDAVLASRARPVHVVTGHQAEAVRAALAGRPVRFVPCPDYERGMSASLRAGIASLPPDVAAAVICLGDMPLVTSADIDLVLAAYNPEQGARIVVPVHAGRRGNPVLWDRVFFKEIAALDGDRGAKDLLCVHAASIVQAAMPGDGIVRDFDTE